MTYELPFPELYDAIEDVPCHSDETLRAEVAKAEKRGAEAMRERCIAVCAEVMEYPSLGPKNCIESIKELK